MSASEIGVLFAVGFAVFFVLIWCFVLWVVSLVSGWRRLASRFGDTSMFSGDVTAFGSARIGLANYSATLIVGASDEGLYVVPMRIFRPFHRPLFIPWTETEAESRGGAHLPRVRLTFPTVPGTSILLYGRSAQRCMPYLRRRFGFDD